MIRSDRAGGYPSRTANRAPWDYLIITASNAEQAAAYSEQIDLRVRLGLISGIKNVLVLPDPGEKRVGSGGSTLHCLISVLNRELTANQRADADSALWKQVFQNLRILIVHAGGDAKRLPPYSPCGKIFIPVPGENDSALELTLIDRLLPQYLDLPPMSSGQGQVVVTTGDVLLRFDPTSIRFAEKGMTGIGCFVSPETAKNHGVFCPDKEGRVRYFLQKPSLKEQAEKQALLPHGQAVLDIGIMNLDSGTVIRLLSLCGVACNASGNLEWSGPVGEAIEEYGLDFYSEFSCAMGNGVTYDHYAKSLSRTGSRLSAPLRHRLFSCLSPIPFFVEILPRCGFLHFGTLSQLITSGGDLQSWDLGLSRGDSCLSINNIIRDRGSIRGDRSWVEGCRIQAPLELSGNNVVVGLDVSKPLFIPNNTCLDVLPGLDDRDRRIWFVRIYGLKDFFKETDLNKATFGGRPFVHWIKEMDVSPEEIWGHSMPAQKRSLWNARLFPVTSKAQDFRKWLWLLHPSKASASQKASWKSVLRTSMAAIAKRAAHKDFHARRMVIRAWNLQTNLSMLFRLSSSFSAQELAYILSSAEAKIRKAWIAEILAFACMQSMHSRDKSGSIPFELSRLFHSLGSALSTVHTNNPSALNGLRKHIDARLEVPQKKHLRSLGLNLETNRLKVFAESTRNTAFRLLSRTILFSSQRTDSYPHNSLKSDEIIWSRAPARLDLGGGWSDTPPYSLENGGCVINAAVNLNGQAPIQAYARVIPEKEIRINSIDHSARTVIRSLDDLLDFQEPQSQFGLAKAALVLSGFSPETASWPAGVHTLCRMLVHFGGGIELTTLAAIPSGSGLGTSSIMGAVLLSAIHRLLGRTLSRRELFHEVLKLEQKLTTGGGWQDQIGGVVDGVKMITTSPGLVPDPRIEYVPPDVLDPRINKGRTLLYYTGIRRLAKNILREVVGRYLNRDRQSMEILRRLHAFPPRMVECMAQKDLPAFGGMIDLAWRLNKALDPDSTNETIDGLLETARPHIFGAKLLGAGGGGFLLFVCRSQKDAGTLKSILTKNPPNELARFFDFDISTEGLVVSVC